VVWPALSGPSAVPAFFGSLGANLVRNAWSHAIIFCGHFPDGAETFDYTEEQLEGETRGDWYVRQLLGSANLDGGRLFHIMAGNLSFQIEHHLFPDVPSNRYHEIAPRVREVCEHYGLPYTSGPLYRQYAQVLIKIARYAVPGGGRSEASEPRDEEASPPATTERALKAVVA
jgi:linoleoyl-CoA desaturase